MAQEWPPRKEAPLSLGDQQPPLGQAPTPSGEPAGQPTLARDYARHFAMPTQEAFKEKGRWRLLGATVLTLLAIGLFVFLGPSQKEVKRRFEFSGAEGPMKIMPELSIEDGADRRHQDPKYYRNTPPPPNVEVVPDRPRPDAPVEVPVQQKSEPFESEIYADVSRDPDLDLVDQVEMQMPQQTNPWFVLIRMVRPEYPSQATEEQRRTPVIIVEVAFFVNEEGKVTASYILSSTGGEVFNVVVLKAVNQWVYKPVYRDGQAPQGFWNRLTIRFKSPYFRS